MGTVPQGFEVKASDITDYGTFLPLFFNKMVSLN